MKNIIIVVLLTAFVFGCGKQKEPVTKEEFLQKAQSDSIKFEEIKKYVDNAQKNIDSINNAKYISNDELQRVFRTKIK